MSPLSEIVGALALCASSILAATQVAISPPLPGCIPEDGSVDYHVASQTQIPGTPITGDLTVKGGMCPLRLLHSLS